MLGNNREQTGNSVIDKEGKTLNKKKKRLLIRLLKPFVYSFPVTYILKKIANLRESENIQMGVIMKLKTQKTSKTKRCKTSSRRIMR